MAGLNSLASVLSMAAPLHSSPLIFHNDDSVSSHRPSIVFTARAQSNGRAAGIRCRSMSEGPWPRFLRLMTSMPRKKKRLWLGESEAWRVIDLEVGGLSALLSSSRFLHFPLMVSDTGMGDQISTSTVPPTSSSTTTLQEISADSITIPQPLKFLVSNIKNLAPHHLTTDNYPIWSMQILQQFAANGYSGHLTGTLQAPNDITSDAYIRWKTADSNLLSALFSTISQSILPYIINSATTNDAWTVLERRLQPTSRSRVMQLKNELYRITMKDQSLQQYLNRIKSIVDNISASGSKVESEDVILHILNGLPPTFNSFKSTIRNSLSPIDLDTFYSLLCNEEIHLQQEQ